MNNLNGVWRNAWRCGWFVIAACADGGTLQQPLAAGGAAAERAGGSGSVSDAAPTTAPGRVPAGASGMMAQTRAGRAADGVTLSGAGSAGVERAGGAGAAAGSGAQGAGAGGIGASPMSGPCPEPPEVCKILPLGDSITYGIGYDGGYRVELFRRAIADGKKLTFSGSVMNGPRMVEGMPFPRNNEGHSGWKIEQLEPLIPAPALDEVPHIILLMIGTNDVAQNDALRAAPQRLAALLDLLAQHAPGALVVVATILPLGRSSSAVDAYNEAIPAVVAERADAGKKILLVDQFDGFPASELGDGVHPNQQGYERMAAVWYEAIGGLVN